MKHAALLICQLISEKHLALLAIYMNLHLKTSPNLPERMEQEHKLSKPKKIKKYDFLFLSHGLPISMKPKASLLIVIDLLMPAIKSSEFTTMRPVGEKQHLWTKILDKFRIIILNNAFAFADFYLSNSGCQCLKVPRSHHSSPSIQCCCTLLIYSLF